ncbi:MAG TPA: oxidoreductase [Flavobacterium sp.]|uniref:WD40/YVTN/BNR-like repeat-containing protein n=1 Tax=Flavobacterium sp. TaxID=239 RepID=UPI002DC0545C|nr:oxidoreductase [Flavobacterium sp.]HEU4790371.1 oxidoreductase [Flavobacterium sp.]
MMRIFFVTVLFFSGLCFVNAQKKNKLKSANFSFVQIDTLFEDKISIRAIVVDHDNIWYAGDKNRFGFYDLKSNKKFENAIVEDTLKIEFRSIAKTSNYIYVLSVANPGLLYQITKDGKKTKLVYQEKNEKVFYDSMQFWNDKEGIAIGDPITDCLSIIRTHDGGNSWAKLQDSKLPKVFEGEAHFAASNTNIIAKGNDTWIVSGGKKSRVFYSPDKGDSWNVYEVPIVQGKQMTGIFTADFYDSKNGFISGGNYELLNQNWENKAITDDGGKTWKLIANNEAFGYASCVQYVPNSKGKGIVVVGASGLYYSSDGGVNWVQFNKDPSLYTIRFVDKTTAIAAGRNKMIRIRFK